MRRLLALLMIAVLAAVPSACRKTPEGTIKAVVIGGAPQLRDPAQGSLSPPDAQLIQSVAQGLVAFDAGGNIVAGLAERWNVSNDGLSYIFRIASAQWPDGRKIDADQVARILKRELGPRSKNPLKDTLGAIVDVVPMTDRVIEIQLSAPRPNLLALLAQPEMAILRGSDGTGPFRGVWTGAPGGEQRLTREIVGSDEEAAQHQEVLLAGAPADSAVGQFAAAQSDLVLGGTFADLAFAQRARLPRASLRFDPASGLFGLVPLRNGGALDKPDVRNLLSEAIDRDNFIAVLGVPGLVGRATLLEPGLDGIPPPVAPAWLGTPPAARHAALQAQADHLFGKAKPTIRVFLPEGPGADLLFQELSRDWGALGITVERSPTASADFVLIDEIAPSSSPAWFVRRFRCGAVPVCSSDADQLAEAARQSQVPAQRYALIVEGAAKIDDAVLFIPLAAPVRWSLVSRRIQGFAGNRYARHTLIDLEMRPGGGE